MTKLAELEKRIDRALERIAHAAATMRAAQPAPAASGGDSSENRAQLESERARNADLTERLEMLRRRHDGAVTTLERRLARLMEQLDLQSLEMLRLKKANTKLIEANRQLREGNEAQVIEPSAINRSLVAELEALRAERAAELAEMEDVLAELKPLLSSEESHA